MRVLLVMLLAACAGGPARQEPALQVSATPIAGGRRVVAVDAWLTYDRLPGSWEHLFRGEVTGPYYLAFSDRLACRIPSEIYTHLRAGDYLRCAWRTPR